jgi:hypothetical protein
MAALIRGLAYPLKSAPLMLVLIFAALFVMAEVAGMLGVPLTIVLVSWFLKYAFVLFDDVTLGRPEPSVLSYEIVNPLNEQRPLGALIVMGVCYVVPVLFQDRLGSGAVAVIHIVELLLLPACIATLGITGSLIQAVNPRTVAVLALRMGWSYLVVGVVIAFLMAAIFRGVSPLIPHDAESLLSRFSGTIVGQVLSHAVILYCWLAMFCVLATAMYERRAVLDLETWHSPEQAQAKEQSQTDRERDRFVDELYHHWRIASYANARTALEKHIAGAVNPADDYLWIHERVARWPDRRFAQQIARAVIPQLLKEKRTSAMLALVRAELSADITFRPEKASELVSLAQLARSGGDRATARKLVQDFSERFPNDPAQSVVSMMQQDLQS